MKILQNLDQRIFESRNFEPILDTPNETDRADFGANILKQAADESYRGIRPNWIRMAGQGGLH